MASERILVMLAVLLVVILVEQAGLGPRVRAGAWTALAVAVALYLVVRVAPALGA